MKQSDYKSGMKVLFDLEGKTHKGTVEVEGRMIFICQDVLNGAECVNRRGHKFSYSLCDKDGSYFFGPCKDALTNIRHDPEADPEAETVAQGFPAKNKHEFETVFNLNGEAFDITAHRENIKRLSDELKELKAIDRAFVNYQRGDGK